jgi:uncharacterized protein (TIGR03435 family)
MEIGKPSRQNVPGILSSLVVGLLALSAQRVIGQAKALPPQAPDVATQLPAFEVASIKPSKPDEGRILVSFTPDGASYTGVPLQLLLRETFGVEDDRILGTPPWVKTDRFDIEAKVDSADVPKLDNVSFEQRRQMLLPLLEDRFHLKYHHESKQLSTYALVIAKSGLKLKEAKRGDTYSDGLKAPDGHPNGPGAMWVGRGTMTGQGVTVATLIKMLSISRNGPKHRR